MENITLNNNLTCPVIGIGTFMLSPADAENSVREALKMGFVVIPGSKNVAHIKDNLVILDITLTDDEMAEIAKLDKGERYYHRTDEQHAQFAGWRPEFEKA